MRKLSLITIVSLIVLQAHAKKTELSIYHWRQETGLSSNSIQNITQDSTGYIILDCPLGNFRFDGYESVPVTNSIQQKTSDDSTSPVVINHGRLMINGHILPGEYYGVLKSKYGEWWASSVKGIGQINVQQNSFKPIVNESDLPVPRCDNLTEDIAGRIWFSMPLSSLGYWNPETQRVVTLKNILQDGKFKNGYEVFSELVDRQITSLFFDRKENLWVGTKNSGLYKIAFNPVKFQFFRFDYKKHSGLSHRDISFPLATRSGDVWISTWGGGINVWDKNDLDKDEPVFTKIPLSLPNSKPLPEKRIFPLLEDNDKNIWFGTLGGGLYFLSNSDRIHHRYNYQTFNKANNALPSDSVSALCADNNGTVWCGTFGGLVSINAGHKIQKSFPELENPKIFNHLPISMLVKENRDILWIGTFTGTIFRWNLTTHNLQKFSNPGTGVFLNAVKTNNLVWFASTAGLFYYDNVANVFRPFANNKLLPATRVESILTDRKGKLWVGTMHGLAKVNPFNNEVKTFKLPGGIMGSSFTQGASKDKNGYLYFGSRYGFYRFLPENIEFEHPVGKVVINTVAVGGQIFRTDTLWKTTLWKSAKDEKGGLMNLNHNQNTLSFEYHSLNFSPDEVLTYHVFLEGYDREWGQTTDMHRTWRGLPPGNYTLKVKANLYGNPSCFHFVIRQAWWKTRMSIAIFIIIGITLFFIILQIVITFLKRKEKRRQKEKFDQLRFRFFLNVSHEIRTPLTLIKGAIDRLVSEDNFATNHEFSRLKRNSERLIRMVNEVLDLKKLEHPRVEVTKRHFNLKQFLESTIDAFRLRDDSFSIPFNAPDSPVWINTSRELLETIMYNLLSNAIKFSDQKSIIDVSLMTENNYCIIKIKDYGVGIPTEKKTVIFERFYKSSENNKTGAGIGLAIVKEFCELLGGNISVDSEVGKGSTFNLKLPLGDVSTPEAKRLAPSESIVNKNTPTLVIVDDQTEIRSFIKEIFTENWLCFEAANGEEAWKVILKNNPDCVISDAMMPLMDGFDLCKKVRNDIRTSHIPFILLTAKTDTKSEIKAVECRADDFITKPFNEKILKLKVEQIIQKQKQLWAYFRRQATLDFSDVNIPDTEKAFIEKLEEIIAHNIDNTSFSVDALARAAALSTAGLYRKLKTLSGLSPVEFIRNFRLREAAKLLVETKLTITEISDRTGFGTQKYFSRCFKEQYNIPPLQYRKENI